MPRKTRNGEVTADNLNPQKLAAAVLYLLQLAVEYETAGASPHSERSELMQAEEVRRLAWPVLGTSKRLAKIVDLLEIDRLERVAWRKDALVAAFLLSWTTRVVGRFDPTRLSAYRRERIGRVLQLKFLVYDVPIAESDANKLIDCADVAEGGGQHGLKRRIRTALARILGGRGEDYLLDLQTAVIDGEKAGARVQTRERAFALTDAEDGPLYLQTSILAYVLRLLVARLREDKGEIADKLVKMLVFIWDREYADLYGLKPDGEE